MRSSWILLVAGLCLGLLPASPAGAKVFLSKKEALALAFPEADRIEHKTHVLDGAQAEAIERLSGAPPESRLVTLYTGIEDDRVIGYALIDIHTVRTLPEAFMVVISPGGKVESLQVLAFYEPPEYLPSEAWLRQFDDQRLDRSLRIGGAIHGIAGSTLSSRAVTGGVRRSLALFEVLVRGTPVEVGSTGGQPGQSGR